MICHVPRATGSLLLGVLALLVPVGARADDEPPKAEKPRITPAAKGERRPDRLVVGAQAPDFTLPTAAGGPDVTLSDYRGKKPVVLIFASCTWMPFRRRSGDLENHYQTYRSQVEFLLIYIREAHPDSTVPLVQNGKPALQKLGQTNDVQERKRRAEELRAELQLNFPALVDRSDNRVNTAYASWPERLVVVDAQGKVAYKSVPNPRGFKPEEVGQWLKQHVK